MIKIPMVLTIKAGMVPLRSKLGLVPMIKAVIVPMIKDGMLSRDQLTYDVQDVLVQLFKYKYFIESTKSSENYKPQNRCIC